MCPCPGRSPYVVRGPYDFRCINGKLWFYRKVQVSRYLQRNKIKRWLEGPWIIGWQSLHINRSRCTGETATGWRVQWRLFVFLVGEGVRDEFTPNPHYFLSEPHIRCLTSWRVSITHLGFREDPITTTFQKNHGSFCGSRIWVILCLHARPEIRSLTVVIFTGLSLDCV